MSIHILAQNWLNTARSISMTGAVIEVGFKAFKETAIKNLPEKVRQPVSDWIDYPQSLIAGIILLSMPSATKVNGKKFAYLGIGFTLFPIICKTIRAFTHQKNRKHQSPLYNLADLGDRILRIAAKAIVLIDKTNYTIKNRSVITTIRSTESIESLIEMSQGLLLYFYFVIDCVDTFFHPIFRK